MISSAPSPTWAPGVCFDRLGGRATGWPLLEPDPQRDLRRRLPAGLKLALPDGQSLGDPGFPELLRALHHGLLGTYATIRSAFSDRDDPPAPLPAELPRPRPGRPGCSAGA
ncbi:MAG TPA: hypothetical protein VGO87_14855 [Acidimicrobiia bacterium]